MNRKAIAVYLDNNDRGQAELSWLYKSWLLHGLDSEFDLVVYHHPDAKERFEPIRDRPQVLGIAMAPLANARNYRFLNSKNILLEPFSEPLDDYEFLLITDCDTFLTQNIRRTAPQKILIGRGAYCAKEDPHHEASMNRVCNHFGFEHKGLINIGCSFYGRTEEVIKLVRKQVAFTEFFLSPEGKTVFWDFYRKGTKGVASLLGGEIAVNLLCEQEDVLLESLDTKCSNKDLNEQILHIHAWHTAAFWSKHQFFDGRYRALKIDFIDAFTNTGSYCHWIASASVDEVKRHRDLLEKLR